MNTTILRNINLTVEEDDVLYFLGDIGMNIKNKEALDLLSSIKCDIVFIKGNHDGSKLLKYLQNNSPKGSVNEKKFTVEEVGLIHKADGKSYYLSHYPLMFGEQRKKLRSIHGHIHGEASPFANAINIGVDSPEHSYLLGDKDFGVPVLLDTAIDLVEIKWFEYDWLEKHRWKRLS